MKSTKTLTTMTCDSCGIQLAEAPDQLRFGSAPFTGWYTLKKLGGSSRIDPTRPRERKEWDFCSVDCLIKFTDLYKIKKVTPASALAEDYFTECKKKCGDKMVAQLTGKLDVHCMSASNRSTSSYPVCSAVTCPIVLEKFGSRKTDG